MKPVALALSLILATAGAVFAQEREGPGRYEINALPAGAMFFAASGDEPEFGNYLVGGQFTVNLNRWVGIEAEGGNLVGVRQNVTFNELLLTDQHVPTMLSYSGNVIVNPWGNDRRFVPFVVGGLGGLTMFESDEVSNLGITSNSTFWTGSVGGGLKWYSAGTWGLRGEYRFTAVDGKSSAPAFFGRESRYAHRVSVGLLLTY
jgi:hypothetical protein